MFNINVDLSQLDDLLDLGPTLKRVAAEAGEELSKMAVAKAKEIAAQKLHTRRKMYQDGLKYEKIDENTFLISLDAKVRWIDDGQTAFDMLKGLLNSPKAKYGKNGKYIIIPFDHSPGGKGGSDSRVGRTSAQQDLVNTIKKETLASKNIPFNKIEKGADGQDLTGKLHSFNISNAPKKMDSGPGQRRGPVGEVMQGSKGPGQKQGTPFLEGVSVYQTKGKNGKTKRSIMTFRVASEAQTGMAKWEHPGNAAVDILEKAVPERPSRSGRRTSLQRHDREGSRQYDELVAFEVDDDVHLFLDVTEIVLQCEHNALRDVDHVTRGELVVRVGRVELAAVQLQLVDHARDALVQPLRAVVVRLHACRQLLV